MDSGLTDEYAEQIPLYAFAILKINRINIKYRLSVKNRAIDELRRVVANVIPIILFFVKVNLL